MAKVGAWTVMAMNEGEDLFAQGPECDFCKIPVEPDDTLNPIYVGELPQPKPHYLSAVERKNRMSSQMRILGHEGESFIALYRALQDCPDIDMNISNVVDEVRAVNGDTHFVTEDSMEYGSIPEPTEFETRRNRDKVGVELKIRPKDVTYEPDAEVCDVCAEMFESMGR